MHSTMSGYRKSKGSGRNALCVAYRDPLHARDYGAAGAGLSASGYGHRGSGFPAQGSGQPDSERWTSDRVGVVAQSFTSDRYFHPRPSAAGNGYDATASGGSNLAQSNTKLVQRVQGDIDKLSAENPGKPVPIDMVTTSGSGLDPDITPDNANFQAPRVTKARGLSEDQVRNLIAENTSGRQLGLLGEPRINVLALNLALDKFAK